MERGNPVLLRAYNKVLGRSQHVQATGNALHTLNEANAAIHQGEAYHFGSKFNIAPDGVALFSAIPNSYKMHWDGLAIQSITGPVEINFYKNSEIGSSSILSAINRDLDISSGSSTVIHQVYTLTTTGDLVIPSANLATSTIGGKDVPGESAGLFDGLLLGRGKTYTVGLHNTSADSTTIWANFQFLEPGFL